MKQWLHRIRLGLAEPSLVRRSTLSVLPAFVMVWMVLLAYVYVEARRAADQGPGFRNFGNALCVALGGARDNAEAVAIVAATATWVNIRRQEIGRLPGIMLFELRDLEGKRLYASPELSENSIQKMPAQTGEQILQGQVHRIYQGKASQWQLRIGEPRRGDAHILRFNAPYLVPYLLLALPFVLIPVWFSVRHSLLPLQRLAANIAGRNINDFRPVTFHASHRELKPLVHALDTMLLQLRQQVARERALVQNAAHELRTPMAVIAAQAHALAGASNDQDRSEAQHHLEHAIERLSLLTRQLLELAALDDSLRPAPQSADLAQLTRKVMAQAAPRALGRHIELVLSAPDTLAAHIDVLAFQSVLENLLDNALRYVHEGAQVLLSLRHEEGLLQLSVEDNGPGIPDDELPRVFERFYRGSHQQVSGSGLGLAIVKQATLTLGGTVAVTAGLGGRGAGFHVTLPWLH
jgi:two-component system sensor histidine kinase QseC